MIDRGREVAEGTADELKASVGTSSLQLRLADAADTDDAVAVAPRARRAPASRPSHRPDHRRWTDPDRVADLLIRLRETGIITEMSVQKPTLDEVFLTITGHGTDDRAPPTTHPKESR